MVHKHKVQGRIYRFKPKTTCLELGIAEAEISSIPSRVTTNLVLVIDTVKGRKGYVDIMAITSQPTLPGTYLPISPTLKKHYPLQIQLCNNRNDNAELVFTRLPGRGDGYLRVDERWEVPVRMLEGLVDGMGDEIRVRMKRRGGMGELREWIGRWGRERERERERKGREEVEQTGEDRGEETRKHDELIGDKHEGKRTEPVGVWTMVTEGIWWGFESLGRALNPM